MSRQPVHSLSSLWIIWTAVGLASAAIGLVIGFVLMLLPAIGTSLGSSVPIALGMAVSILVGQWLVVRHFVRGGSLWFLSSIGGLLLGAVSVGVISWMHSLLPPQPSALMIDLNQPPLVLPLLIYGTSVGVGQWVFMRRFGNGAGWWVVATAAGASLVGFALGGRIEHLLDLLWFGLFPAVITGLVFARLVGRYDRPDRTQIEPA
jgi:hypothetical protein